MSKPESFLDKLKENKLVKKLKAIKHVEIIIAIVVIAIMILIYSLSFGRTDEKNANVETAAACSLDGLETELASVLSNIGGAGKVRVLITYEGSTELITAETTVKNSSVTHDKSTGQILTEVVSETKNPIVVTVNGTSTPIVLTEVLPKIKGVIVVAEGADDVSVKLQLIRAVRVALNVDANKIEIFAMN